VGVTDQTPGTTTFSGRAVLVMVLAGVFAFAAFIVLLAYAPDLRKSGDGGGHALSRSAAGYAALVQLARAQGLTVQLVRGGRDLPNNRIYRVLTPGVDADPAVLCRALQRRGAHERVLVVLPKWRTQRDPAHPGWVRRAGLVPAARVQALLGDRVKLDLQRAQGVASTRVTVDLGDRAAYVRSIGSIDQLQTAAPSPGARAAVIDDQGRALLLVLSDDTAVLTDPDLFNTQGLKHPDRARLAIDILKGLAGTAPIVFDLSVNGVGGDRNVLKLAFEPPFLAATLCAALAAALIGWHAASRFGAPRPSGRALAFGKSALADNSAALLRLAGREPHMAAPYAHLTLEIARRAVGVPRTLERESAQAMLDRLSGQAGAPQTASALLAEAEAAKDTPALMHAARRLYEFRRRMTRE
jgi:hypothetical protein